MFRALLGCGCIAVATALGGCGSADSPVTKRDPRAITSAAGDTGALVAGNNAFAWALYAQAAKQPGNVFLSPFSVSAALALVYAGAAGNTATQLHDALHIGLDDDPWHAAFGALMRDLGGPHARGYQLLVANALFAQRGFDIAEPYVSRTTTDYGVGLTPVDFAGDPDGARQQINQWVGAQTEQTIPELLRPGALDSLAVLVAANAIYFHASWAKAFDPRETRISTFYRDDGTTVEVPMMGTDGEHAQFRLSDDDQATAFELPYQDGELAMVIVLPKGQAGLPAFEAQLDPSKLEALVSTLTDTDPELEVSLPKWALHFELPLVSALEALGVTDAFDPATADLSGISSGAGLYLSGAWHQAYIAVDERGTTAAAATAVESGYASAPPSFRADRPFLYLIRDRLTGSILFVGRVSDPSQ